MQNPNHLSHGFPQITAESHMQTKVGKFTKVHKLCSHMYKIK